MKKEYRRPLIEINVFEEKDVILALSVTDGTTVAWTPDTPDDNGYKNFEW